MPDGSVVLSGARSKRGKMRGPPASRSWNTALKNMVSGFFSCKLRFNVPNGEECGLERFHYDCTCEGSYGFTSAGELQDTRKAHGALNKSWKTLPAFSMGIGEGEEKTMRASQ